MCGEKERHRSRDRLRVEPGKEGFRVRQIRVPHCWRNRRKPQLFERRGTDCARTRLPQRQTASVSYQGIPPHMADTTLSLKNFQFSEFI